MANMDARAGDFLELCRTRYRDEPVLFAKEVLGIELTEKQQKPALTALAKGTKRKVAVKSGHGTGKSCMEAVTALWFLCTRPMGMVIVTAPSSNQLYNTMMKEIRDWYNKSILKEFNLFRFTKDRVRINHDEYCTVWFLAAVSVANPENISGSHAKDILAIIDEGAGVDTEIYVRLEGVLTTEGSYMIVCGNPSFDSGYFYDIFHNPNYSAKYDLFTFNCENSPNVTEKWINDMKEKYGADSNIYKVRVLGEFAPLDQEVVIRREDVKRAIGRAIPEQNEDVVFIGVDVSGGDSNDSSVICVRKGLQELERIKVKDKLRDLQSRIKVIISKYLCSCSKVVLNIDSTGLGTQLGQDLDDYYYTKDNVEVNCLNFSYRAYDYKSYGNIATEMFYCIKEIINKVSLLDIPESTLEEDLGSRRYGYDHKNRYVIERKKDFVKRFKRSPDEGDAVILAFFDVGLNRELSTVYIDKEEW